MKLLIKNQSQVDGKEGVFPSTASPPLEGDHYLLVSCLLISVSERLTFILNITVRASVGNKIVIV